MIFLDTNILPRSGPLDAPHIAVLDALAAATGHTLVLPSVAVTESVSARRRDATDAFSRLVSAHRTASKFALLAAVYVPDPTDVAREWEVELRRRFEIAPIPIGAAEEALRREAERIPPAREGRGARDCAIWLTLLHEHASRSEESFFVSENKADFGCQRDSTILHGYLAAEVPVESRPLRYHSTFTSLVEALATATELDISTRILQDAVAVRDAMVRAVDGVAVRQLVLAHESGLGAIAGASPLYPTGPVGVTINRLSRSSSFRIGEAGLFAIVWGSCTATFEAGALVGRVPGAREVLLNVVLHLDVRFWLQLSDCAAAVEGCEVASVTTTSAEAPGSGYGLLF